MRVAKCCQVLLSVLLVALLLIYYSSLSSLPDNKSTNSTLADNENAFASDICHEDKYLTEKLKTCEVQSYPFKYNSVVEQQFPIAYVVLMHYWCNSTIQYMRLLHHLHRPQNIICFHIDQKSPKNWVDAIKTFAHSCYDNIIVAHESVEVTYAGPGSMLTAHLSCLKELHFNHTNHAWRYVIDLHGTELPLVTNRDIINALTKAQGVNFVPRGTHVNSMNKTSLGYKRVTYKAVVLHDKSVITNEYLGPVPYNMSIYKSSGSPNGAYSREFVDYVLTSPKAIALYKYLKDVSCAEEYYFSTLNNLAEAPGGWHAKKHLKVKPITVSTRLFKGKVNKVFFCGGGYFRHNICIVSFADIPWLNKLSIKRLQFFHNKYLVNYDSIIMDFMDMILKARNIEEQAYDMNYYNLLSLNY